MKLISHRWRRSRSESSCNALTAKCVLHSNRPLQHLCSGRRLLLALQTLRHDRLSRFGFYGAEAPHGAMSGHVRQFAPMGCRGTGSPAHVAFTHAASPQSQAHPGWTAPYHACCGHHGQVGGLCSATSSFSPLSSHVDPSQPRNASAISPFGRQGMPQAQRSHAAQQSSHAVHQSFFNGSAASCGRPYIFNGSSESPAAPQGHGLAPEVNLPSPPDMSPGPRSEPRSGSRL
jgi:hypothetical protein